MGLARPEVQALSSAVISSLVKGSTGTYSNFGAGTPEAAAEQFALRREVVESIVDRIEVDADKYAHVTFIFDFSEIGTVVSQNNSILQEFLGNSSLKDFKLWEAK
jgi:hypothetical protein